MATTTRKTQLFFQEGNSDKVYNATILKDGDLFSVHVEWGRRGVKLNEGHKAVKVPLAEANKVFDRLVREKTGKGYQEIGGEVKPAAVAPPEGQGSGSKVTGKRAKVGYSAQLLNPIEDDELEAFLSDDRLLAQQKLDGNRVLVCVQGDDTFGTNRSGQKTDVPKAILEGVGMLPEGTVVDGEVLGGEYWLFDVLKLGEREVTSLTCEARWQMLSDEIEPGLSGPVRVLKSAIGAKAKRALYQTLLDSKAEGIVFKERKAPYTAGRPASKGTQRKHKFIKSADVVLVANAGNAYQMVVFDGGKRFEVGKVFAGTTNASRKVIDGLLANEKTPVAEVKYLYATDDEQLFQPVFVRLRDDKKPKECVRAQLRSTNRAVIE